MCGVTRVCVWSFILLTTLPSAVWIRALHTLLRSHRQNFNRPSAEKLSNRYECPPSVNLSFPRLERISAITKLQKHKTKPNRDRRRRNALITAGRWPRRVHFKQHFPLPVCPHPRNLTSITFWTGNSSALLTALYRPGALYCPRFTDTALN